MQNNTQPGSGLVNGKDRYPIVSLWNIGDSLIALSAARRLDLIPQREFDARLSALLTTLDRLPVTRIGAPGALYDAVSGAFSQNGGTAGEAQGMARLLVGMRFTAQSFPEYRTFLERIALRWNFCNLLTQDGQPLDGREQNGAWRSAAASDVGYADYNGAAFRLWGFQRTSTRTAPFKTAVVYGEPSPLRHAIRASPARPPASKAPLSADRPRDGMAGTPSRRGGRRQHGTTGPTPLPAQETRWRREKILTARAQYSRSTAPWEVYDSLFANGYAEYLGGRRPLCAGAGAALDPRHFRPVGLVGHPLHRRADASGPAASG